MAIEMNVSRRSPFVGIPRKHKSDTRFGSTGNRRISAGPQKMKDGLCKSHPKNGRWWTINKEKRN